MTDRVLFHICDGWALGSNDLQWIVYIPGADLVIDATGIGRATVDALEATGLKPVAVTITGGRETHFEDGMWRVPKCELIRPLAVALEGGRLRIAKEIADAPTLLRELRVFSVSISERGHARFEGKREHDDLVIAVALAVWWRIQANRQCPLSGVKQT